ncbi:acetyl-CoA carboxylase carboxyltransferase subunit alpha [Amycolatopsis granulosa]|uniref:acetyl-CoA carboxylase carboxyltransferase subunit alpha n=1 Tax=Amycolatopsis granulosa TaxID=185684 RepID=UPI00312CC22A|nr:acetyl-CoA carboxylase carboxyl transferase subunit beta [Amycolatopsis granulosa]
MASRRLSAPAPGKLSSVSAGDAAGWVSCPGCRTLLYRKRLARDLGVCAECGHHTRLSPWQRIAQLVDVGTFVERTADALPPTADRHRDPLGFHDQQPYRHRLATAGRESGEPEAVVFGTAEVGGFPLVVAVLDFRFLGGSMGTAVGECVTAAAERARRTRTPLLLVTSSGGARMQEGCLSLMQMAKTAQAMARLRDDGVLSVCLLTDPTFGGVSASFATLGHVVLAEAGALVGFAGPRVISETVGQELPAGFQTADFLADHGMVDAVVPRAEVRPLVRRLLRIHAPGARTRSGPGGGAPAIDRAAALTTTDPWETVRRARHVDRPSTADYLATAFDEFCELRGDRCFGDDPAVIGGPARIGDRPVMLIGHQKGHTTSERVASNFGMAHPEGYRKARRLMEYAASLRLPVVCLVDTPGAYPGIEAEERGQATAIAECIARASTLPVPIVSVITGEGGSGGALALATADRVLMLENGFYSVISPEGCAAILWRSADAAAEAARALRITAPELLDLGIVDAVVPEPAGGAQLAPDVAAANLRRAVLDQLDELAGIPARELLSLRYRRFRSFGERRTSEVRSA